MRQKFSVFTQHDAKVVYASINAAEQFQFGYKSSKYKSSISLAYYNTSFLLDRCKYSGEPSKMWFLIGNTNLKVKDMLLLFIQELGLTIF